jgi:hypothetical protein
VCRDGLDWVGTSPNAGFINSRFERQWANRATTNGSCRRCCRYSFGAYPHQFRSHADPGTIVNLDLGRGARWHLVGAEAGWDLAADLADSAVASITSDLDSAWRLLTGASTAAGSITVSGPVHLARPLLEVGGIIV